MTDESGRDVLARLLAGDTLDDALCRRYAAIY